MAKNPAKRGSERLLATWNTRVLTEESVREIAGALEGSPAIVEAAKVVGGAHATGVALSLSYEGDDVPWYGNDIQFWLKWHLKHGGVGRPPRIIINGIPFPDVVHLELEFGTVGQPGPSVPGGPLGAGVLGE